MKCEKSLQCFIIGDRVRINSCITRRVGTVVNILENGHLVVRFPFGYKKNSSCGFLELEPSFCWKVK